MTVDIVDHPVYEKAVEECNHSDLKVATSLFGDYSVSALGPAIIYAHGGGVVTCSASTHKPFLSKVAVKCGVVVFNVDYRRPPETKCPNNILDFDEVFKYVKLNSESLGIDASRIAIAGESGGGYICFGAMVLLSQRNESDMVKLAMPNIPMVDDDSFRKGSTGIENLLVRKMWKFIANDLEAEKNDPLLFPGKASDQILEHMPPTIVWSAEFCVLVKETTRTADSCLLYTSDAADE